MLGAFSKLSADSSASPEALAEDLQFALVGRTVGLTVGLVGAILILIAFCGLKNREKWFYWGILLVSISWSVVAFPVGLVVGVTFAAMAIRKREEFRIS